MKLTFLSAEKPLTKSFIFTGESYDVTPYPLTAAFTSHVIEVDGLEDFCAQLVVNGNRGRCLLRGSLIRSIVRESRAGLLAQEPTSWFLLDFDNLDLQERSLDDLLKELDLDDTDYILQYSSSQGIKNGFNAHVFFLLDRPYAAEQLKLWIKHKNISAPMLRSQLTLTKSNMALHWPLDVTVNQLDKIIYIAPPIFIGREDPISQRIQFVKKNRRTLSLTIPSIVPDAQVQEIIRQLRAAQGFPDRELVTKYFVREKAEVLPNPDKAAVTGIKRHGPFTYINLNGGDSWGYYHLTLKPAILYNFKGEPFYKLQDLAPDYFSEALNYSRVFRQEAHIPKPEVKKTQRFVINRRDEGRYYKVTYDPQSGVSLDPAPTLKHINDFCVLHNIATPEIIEDWSVEFNPTTTTLVDVDKKVINTYVPTIYRLVPWNESSTIPELYMRLITHVCGNDAEASYRFINWLAYIWQTGKKPQTAWVLHGTFGTGKGRLLHLLQKLFGQHCVVVSPESISEHFNASIEHAQILWIDEVTTDAWDNQKMTPKLRNWITEDTLSIRGMRQNSRSAKNYMGIIIAANEHNPVEIRIGDRRYNVAPRQETKLLDLSWSAQEVIANNGWLYKEENIMQFAAGLFAHRVDDQLVLTPLENEAKTTVMQVTQSLPEDIVQALLSGDVSFFLEYIDPSIVTPSIEYSLYKSVVDKMMRGGRVPIATKELSHIFTYLAGWNQAPAKFSKAVSKYGLKLSGKVAREGNRTYAGTYFEFNVKDQDRHLWAQAQGPDLRIVKQG